MSNADVRNMWNVIYGLNGTVVASSSNEDMPHKGHTIT